MMMTAVLMMMTMMAMMTMMMMMRWRLIKIVFEAVSLVLQKW